MATQGSVKVTFTEIKKLFKIDDINVNKMLVSKKEPHGNTLNAHVNTFLGIMVIM